MDNLTSLDKTVRIFDSFYSLDLMVGAAQYDIVYGYFSNVCKTKNIADNFTTTLFRISTQTGVDVLSLLEQIKGSPNNVEMNKIMCYYLNSLKSKTSLYGVSIIPRPVLPVARNIVH